jgi:hypothetical protein
MHGRLPTTALVVVVLVVCVTSQPAQVSKASKCKIDEWKDYLAAEASARSCVLRCDDYVANPMRTCFTKADCDDGSDCKPRKLVLTRERHIFELEDCCKKELDKLKRDRFGPPGRYEKRVTSCDGMCAVFDAMIFKGKTSSKCNCEETQTCTQSSMFWLCKLLWECLGSNDDDYQNNYQTHWCSSCGAAQADPIDFYDELDCGVSPTLATHSVCISFIMMAFVHNLFAV